ncbi:uncharacterized protein LOC130828629 [Amaranthus tricolor]|uniref:uncharacterized protein LOC130828629 n=1 Tax=Amaranthus tricolor TaxID=29722 RepID=UPI0025891096|nr:uncharacterized protein LOC130828629 [Amaranthus tricolor]
MDLPAATKIRIQDFEDNGWEGLLHKVTLFCDKHGIPLSEMNALYADIIRSRHNKDSVTVEHHYKVDIFTAAVDQQLQELNSRFNEQRMELLILSFALNPKDNKYFNAEKICRLAKKYYSRVEFEGTLRGNLHRCWDYL